MQDDRAQPGERVLVVEDDRAFCELVRLHLVGQGWDVLIAHDGVEGLEVLEGEPPHAVICDITMPRMGGLEFCRRLRGDARHRHLPIMILSGADESAAVGEVVGLGHIWYLGKGGGAGHVGRTLRHLIDSMVAQPAH